MTSSQPFISSSPLSPSKGHRRRKSKYTFKHLAQLRESSTQCPLRVIAHIDLDAFYAQCETIRLGLPEDQPLVVQQWQGLIAVNYAARKFGVARFVTIAEAKKLCPNIFLQHVATWREGDEKWAYHEDSYKHMDSHKVSLDPYRQESRKILSLIKETLPATPFQKVEKAGIDEVFLDLSAQVHSILLEQYAELQGPPPYGDPHEHLPAPPTTALDWNSDGLIDLDNNQTEDEDPDWDDIVMMIGSDIVRTVRKTIRHELHYTCSGGIAKNKMLAKLGSAHKKPNNQTIVRNRAIQNFLSEFKFTKIRYLGGKLGDEVVSMFNTDTVKDLLEIPMDQLKRLGDDTGAWLHKTIRGEDTTEVNSRTQIKSMLSAKSFRPSINSFDAAARWLRIFVADIFSRLVEEGVLENKRRPKTINLHHRQGGQTRSKQSPIPTGKTINETVLFELSKNLMAQVIVDGRAWPCSNLSLSVGGFEDGPVGNRGIGSFLVRGEEAKMIQSSSARTDTSLPFVNEQHVIGKHHASNEDCKNFFGKQEDVLNDRMSSEEDNCERAEFENVPPSTQPQYTWSNHDIVEPIGTEHKTSEPFRQQSIESYLCAKCNRSLPVVDRLEHEDWHFAKDLQYQDQDGSSATQRPALKSNRVQKSVKGKSKSSRGAKQSDKTQSRLAFDR